MAVVTTQTPATPGLLEQVNAEWRARGWDPATLSTFRMEGEGGDGGGGDGGGNGGQGGAASSPPPAAPPATPPAPAAGNEPDLAGLQAALDVAQGSARNEALAPLMQAIGVDSPEALQTWVTERQAEIDAGKDEATRAREQAERQAAEARAEATQSRQDAFDARVEAALAAAQAPGDHWDDLRRLVDVEPGADRDAITAAVEAVKAKYPALFTASGNTKPTAPHTVPPRQPAGGTPPPTGVDAGRERARKERERRQTTSQGAFVNQFAPQQPSSPFAAN